MWLDKIIGRTRNPHGLTARHLARDAARFGWTIGDYSYGRPRVRHWGDGGALAIGRYCSIADDVTIFLGGNHRTDWVSTYPFSDFPDLWPGMRGRPSTLTSRGAVRIGSDVWIGAGATILSGVTIGDGAVIGARAVVGRDVEPYGIAVGNPARTVRRRIDEPLRARLLALAWWDLPPETVARLAPLLQSDDVAGLVATLEEIHRAEPTARVDSGARSGHI